MFQGWRRAAPGFPLPLEVQVVEGAHEEQAGRGHVHTAGVEDVRVMASSVYEQTFRESEALD